MKYIITYIVFLTALYLGIGVKRIWKRILMFKDKSLKEVLATKANVAGSTIGLYTKRLMHVK